MKGQAKALIPALIGIVILLLAGIGGIDLPRLKQATVIAETRAITPEAQNRDELDKAFHAEAEAAATDMGLSIAADLAVELKRNPTTMVAQNKSFHRERG